MLNDITFGQYFPINSIIHKIDPRTKIVMLIAVMSVLLFFTSNFYALFTCLTFAVLVIILSKIPLLMYLKNLKAILPIIIFTAVINSLYVKTGEVIFDKWIFHITTGGVSKAVFMALRVCLLILFSSVLTYTVTPNDLTEALERLCSPLRFIGLGSAVHIIAMMMTIALRFIPILIEETNKIMNAQRSRGADLESGSIIQRIKALIPILIPLFVMSVRRSYELAEAMECRCYNGGVGRQRMKQMKMAACDYIAIMLVLIFIACVIVLNILF